MNSIDILVFLLSILVLYYSFNYLKKWGFSEIGNNNKIIISTETKEILLWSLSIILIFLTLVLLAWGLINVV